MIRLQDSTPAIYYDQSRDFQLIGRLYDIVLNSVRTNAANVYNLPIGKNMDEKLLNLLSTTLGFQSRHKYNSKQLAAICSVLPRILRWKGSINAILTAVNALLQAEGIKQSLDYSIDAKEQITLYLPQDLSDLTLLQDLLIYILPAGIGCQMVKEISETIKAETNLTTEDTVEVHYQTEEQFYNQMLRINDKDPNNDINRLVQGDMTNSSGILQNVSVSDKVFKSGDGSPALREPRIVMASDDNVLVINKVGNADAYDLYVDDTLTETIPDDDDD